MQKDKVQQRIVALKNSHIKGFCRATLLEHLCHVISSSEVASTSFSATTSSEKLPSLLLIPLIITQKNMSQSSFE